MSNFILWCNSNNGFVSAILSLIGLVLSVTAIVVSIRTARLPYKKKLLLGSLMSISINVIPDGHRKSQIVGISATATNIGNRTVNITYLGYAIKKNGKFIKIFPLNREFDSKALLEPSEKHETLFYKKELLECFSNKKKKTNLFIFATDTEETEYKRKYKNIGKLQDILSE